MTDPVSWEKRLEGAALIELTGDFQVALVTIQRMFDNGQTQTCAARILGAPLVDAVEAFR